MQKKQKKKLNNYAFIDSQNLNLGIKKLGWELDFQRFRVFLQDKFKVKKAFLFIGYIEKYTNLYEELESFGYNLVFKPVISRKNGRQEVVKGNIDAELVLHSMIEFNHYEKAVIVSGDGDFYCLIEYLNKKNKLQRVIVPNRRSYSSLLKEFYDNCEFLDQTQKKLGKTKNGRRRFRHSHLKTFPPRNKIILSKLTKKVKPKLRKMVIKSKKVLSKKKK